MISKTQLAMFFMKDILLELAEYAISQYYTFKSKVSKNNDKCNANEKTDTGK